MGKILLRVVAGKCSGNHKIGDTWEIEYDDERNAFTPQGMCIEAFGAMLPHIWVFINNGEFIFGEKTKIRSRCPDPKGIIWEIEKIK